MTDEGWTRWIFGAGGRFYAAPLIRPGFAGPPSPEGEGFGAVQPWTCYVNPRGRRGHAPALRKARRLASPSGGGAQCAHWAERAFPPTTPYRTGRHPKAWIYRQGIRFALTAAARRPSSVSPAASHLPPRGKALGRWNLVGGAVNSRGRRGHAPALRTHIPYAFVHHPVTNRVTP